ncbi:hypothetical protein KC310_06220 [Enterobacter hormaechei subsp. xiangfangensis]|uniref:hypothetical protein n=1 Tax=Enterobacter hormaechei TaxID=158836 RepID=UPI002569E111|nr:hypothetical protein [Enterobacter hormaechei]MDL4067412.1 hypothetical protein [Enterobacter hormaechei subsp. xiangfangensis]MDR9999268.1 hypothetical protein [Enterobacter hormaechei subsp. xiangfangensis]
MSNIDKQAVAGDVNAKTYYIHPAAFGSTKNPGYGHVPVVHADDFEKQRAKLEAAEKRIAEQSEIMRQAASDISYAIFNLTGSDLSRLNPGVVETTDPTDTALIAERNLRAAAAGKGEAS